MLLCTGWDVQEQCLLCCRSNALKEALGLLYALLRADYLQECNRLAASQGSWQSKEVALYAMRWRAGARPIYELLGHGS